MTDATTAASSSSAGIVEDIIRLVAPFDRPGFHEMFENAIRGREHELPPDELRRICRTHLGAIRALWLAKKLRRPLTLSQQAATWRRARSQ
jgi:hypothetical protein